MLDPVFKFQINPPAAQYEYSRWSRYYSCYLIISEDKVKYLGCIFKDVDSNPEPFYVMTPDHHKPFIYYKTRGAAAAHLLFEDL